MTAIKLIVVDCSRAYREKIRHLLNEWEIVRFFEADTKDEALSAVHSLKPDVVLLSLNLSGSVELLRNIPIECQPARIIAYSHFLEEIYSRHALKHGAKGYVSISSGGDVLMDAITQVADGGYYIDPDISSKQRAQTPEDTDPLDILTLREIEVLRLLGQEKSIAEIAEASGASYKTVANASSILKKKLGLQNSADVIKFSGTIFRKRHENQD